MRAGVGLAVAFLAGGACGDPAAQAPGPLTVLSITPLDGSVDVPRASDVVVEWLRPLDPATLASGLLVAKDSVDLLASGTTSLEASGSRLTFRPSGGFGFNQWIRVLASDGPGGVRDGLGVGLATPFEAFFRTALAPAVATGDPVGDTLATDTLLAERAADLLRLEVSHDPEIATITLTFASPRVLHDQSHPDFLRGVIDLDTDQDPATGVESWVDFLLRVNGFAPITGMGEDYFVDFFEPRGGAALLVHWVRGDSAEVTATLTPVVSGSTVRFDLPITALGRTGGNLHVALFVATSTFITDFLPDSGHVTFGHPGGTSAQLASQRAPAGVERQLVAGPKALRIEPSRLRR